jgi:hypothetical protein
MEYLLLVLIAATLLALGAAYGGLAATLYVMQRTVAQPRVAAPTSAPAQPADNRAA